ncbi:MAG: hypothetical protein M0R03_11530 [Novosphingobium sp.]|nr:hypothetical protein [Novosphingobium sp.]
MKLKDEIGNNGNYRKINDGSHNSSTFHKKDTKSKSLRAKLKVLTRKIFMEALKK